MNRISRFLLLFYCLSSLLPAAHAMTSKEQKALKIADHPRPEAEDLPAQKRPKIDPMILFSSPELSGLTKPKPKEIATLMKFMTSDAYEELRNSIKDPTIRNSRDKAFQLLVQFLSAEDMRKYVSQFLSNVSREALLYVIDALNSRNSNAIGWYELKVADHLRKEVFKSLSLKNGQIAFC